MKNKDEWVITIPDTFTQCFVNAEWVRLLLRRKAIFFFIIICLIPISAFSEWRGNITLEDRYFINPPLHSDQHDNYLSLSVEPEYYHEFSKADLSLTFKPFYRIDQFDNERTHSDIRELFLFYPTQNWEWRAGINKVYWGVTESLHLVDTINQTDFVENIDGEDKLGQPMIQGTWILDDSTLDFFLLPGFRERTFPGIEGRIRGQLAVDTDKAIFESSDKEKHVDSAIRWSGTVFDAWDIGLHYINGTSRDPVLEVRVFDRTPSLVPVYYQMSQFGIDLQATLDAWLLKMELINRQTEPEDFTAFVGGFEYTLPNFENSDLELGLLLEYMHDSRDEFGGSAFQNDVFIGSRWALNDVQSTTFILGGIFDLEHPTRSVRIEANRRIGQNWKITGEAQIFEHIDSREFQYGLRDDDFISLELARFF